MKKETHINLNILNYLGKTSLHYASENGHQSVAELLLDRGANIDQKDQFGEFILSIYLYIYHKIDLPICIQITIYLAYFVIYYL